MSNIDSFTLTQIRHSLLEERKRLLENSKKTLENDLACSPDDLADETDLAVMEINKNLVFKLRDNERILLKNIQIALKRMETGVLNECNACGDEIGLRRLQVQPFSQTCISCAEAMEHRKKNYV